MGLGRHGVLVRDDGVGGGEWRRRKGRRGRGRGKGGRRRGGAGEDGGDDGEVVLKAVEVVGGGGEGVVERVEEGGVERAKGEFGDEVGEVEC